ncbi:MAG TPA: hypothetical protein DCZ05_02240 [Deltaproteobacteria bacterium]|nr:hypothetical protein [Deltaproteobacteria bacterium]
MDHVRAINRLRSRDVLSAALIYAIFDRLNGDFFFDPFEIEHAIANRDTLIDELVEELRNPGQFEPRPAFAYFPPKNELCDRRFIYVPIKDLTVRYAITLIFSEQIETEIHPQCFANRRATGDDAERRFTEDFASGGWGRFCQWQAERCGDNTILLRTDISSFYDSISHDYLIDTVCRHLMLPADCELINLFRRLLRIPVIYYSPSTGQIEGPATIHQGLPIGDGVEGYLANLYLRDVDDAMVRAEAVYGRYVDDIRLFGSSRQQVLYHLRILQEQLLRKGLNLNSSKTEIAEDVRSMGELMSRLYYGEGYGFEKDEQAGSAIQRRIDRPFEEFSRTFTEDQALKKGSDARDFCKFLGAHAENGQPLVALADRQNWHVERLRECVVRWRNPTKHAVWLLAQTATYRGVPTAIQQRARDIILALLVDDSVNSYSRYRLLHHIVKRRQTRRGRLFRFVDHFSADERRRIEDLLFRYLAAPAFELNLLALYVFRILGRSAPELRRIVSEHCRAGCDPIRNALEAVTQIPETQLQSTAALDEPDATPGPY